MADVVIISWFGEQTFSLLFQHCFCLDWDLEVSEMSLLDNDAWTNIEFRNKHFDSCLGSSELCSSRKQEDTLNPASVRLSDGLLFSRSETLSASLLMWSRTAAGLCDRQQGWPVVCHRAKNFGLRWWTALVSADTMRRFHSPATAGAQCSIS